MNRKKLLSIILLASLTFVSCGKTRNAGTYEGVGNGRNGEIKVSVTIDSNGEIEKIEILEHSENKEFIEASFSKIKESMIEKNDYDVDIVSGATMTSEGIKEAVQNALEQSN